LSGEPAWSGGRTLALIGASPRVTESGHDNPKIREDVMVDPFVALFRGINQDYGAAPSRVDV
jgi:hypothetical protein